MSAPNERVDLEALKATEDTRGTFRGYNPHPGKQLTPLSLAP